MFGKLSSIIINFFSHLGFYYTVFSLNFAPIFGAAKVNSITASQLMIISTVKQYIKQTLINQLLSRLQKGVPTRGRGTPFLCLYCFFIEFRTKYLARLR